MKNINTSENESNHITVVTNAYSTRKEENGISDKNKKGIDIEDKTNDAENEKKQTTKGDESPREWYIYLNTETKGPYNLQELLQFWNAHLINHMTFVFKIGETNWKYVYNDETLQKYLLENATENEKMQKKQITCNNLTKSDTENTETVYKKRNASPCENKMEEHNADENGNEIKSISEYKELTNEDLEKMKKREKKKRYLERKKRKIEEGLSCKKIKNSSVYITGLPKDVTKEEINNVFKKAGIIKIDAESTEPKIKIYYDENNNLKGDALVTYVYGQSVDIAIKYFDNFYFRQDCVIHVEKANFNTNTSGNKLKEKKLTKEEKILKKKKIMAAKCEQMRLQKWGDDIYTGTKKKILIFRNIFSLEEAKKYDEGDAFYDSIKKILESAVSKYTTNCKVYPIPKHPKGIVCVKCKKADEAEMLVTCFNNTCFNGNSIEVYFYDGKQDLRAQCLTTNNQCFEEKVEKDKATTNYNKKKEDQFFKESWESFNDWVENQSEDEEHKINVE